MKRIYLKPKAPYRTDLRSDTLFGCLCWGIREVYSEAQLVGLLERFASGEPPFRISSAFPYRDHEGQRTCFFPRPLLRPARLPDALDVKEAKRHKDFRKHQWVSEDTFRKFVSGSLNEVDYYGSGVWEDAVPSVVEEEVLHNAIDRLAGGTGRSGTLFSQTDRYIPEGGLFFLLDGEATSEVESALGFLAHGGLGGDTSIGKGCFDILVEVLAPFDVPEAADRFVTLSLYAPGEREIDAFREGEAWYDLTVRKGKVGGPFLRVDDFWKRSVTMFTEGSTFPLLDGVRAYGCNPIVKGPEDGVPFQVQHYGFAYHIPMHIEAG